MSGQKVKPKKKTRIQQENQERILEAALDVFSANGFRGSTIDMIAQNADMSKPNLLYYFPNKEAIYTTLLHNMLDTWIEPLSAIDPIGDPIEEIRNYISLKLEISRSNPKASQLFAYEILHGAGTIESALRGPFKLRVDQTVETINAWIAQGRLAKVDPYHLIFMIWGTTQHYADFEAQTRVLIGGDLSDDQIFSDAQETLLTVFLQGLMPR